MNNHAQEANGATEKAVLGDMYSQPSLMLQLAENALTVAQSLRDNYFRNTARFVTVLRRQIERARESGAEALLSILQVPDTDWQDLRDELVTFLDGGVGRGQTPGQAPILLRVGSYRVRVGERNLGRREQFGYYPVILGDLEGGTKSRRDFVDIVRITAELLGGLSALERNPDLRVLMFHGPLVYLVGAYAGHTPFTERDVDLFLAHYAPEPSVGRDLKEEFLGLAKLDIYPRMTEHSDEWVRRRLFEPLAWMAFLYRRLIRMASSRTPRPVVVGVVERSRLRDFSEHVLLERVFRALRARDKANYFNELYGRSDLNSPRALLDNLGYTDPLLLAMLLRPGQYSEPWTVDKYSGLRLGDLSLPGDGRVDKANYGALRPGPHGFPRVSACYLQVHQNAEPIRVEVFADLGEDQMRDAVRRVYLYSKLLPGYGFPVGLSIADKYARVPNWMTGAYAKLIQYHLGVSLQRGEVTDADVRRVLVQAIYVTHRDWLFRPGQEGES